MPELPEVEATRLNLERWFQGRTLVRAEADRTRVTRSGDLKNLQALEGPLTAADRRGKYLLLRFGAEQGLIAHLGMTGKFVRRESLAEERFSRARFFLDDGAVLHYTDPRMFGHLIALPAESMAAFPSVAQLGVDPVVDGLTWKQLKAAIGDSRQAVKVVLMDQTRVAGIGNIYAAEALFRAGIHPAVLPTALTDDDYRRLTRTLHASLRFGLTKAAAEEVRYLGDGSQLENPFLIYDRAGTACRACQTPVKSMTQGGRTTHFCPTCQPKRKAKHVKRQSEGTGPRGHRGGGPGKGHRRVPGRART